MAQDTTSAATVRPFLPGDLDVLLPMNNAAVPAVSDLGAEEFLDLINSSLVCLVAEVAGAPAGFLLCLPENIDYASPNYAWLSEREQSFAYTDRICIGEDMRGRRLGEALYQALFQQFAGTGRCFLCEVNSRPPNPGSMRFHERLGFAPMGETDHGDKAVVFLKRAPEPAGGTPS